MIIKNYVANEYFLYGRIYLNTYFIKYHRNFLYTHYVVYLCNFPKLKTLFLLTIANNLTKLKELLFISIIYIISCSGLKFLHLYYVTEKLNNNDLL